MLNMYHSSDADFARCLSWSPCLLARPMAMQGTSGSLCGDARSSCFLRPNDTARWMATYALQGIASSSPMSDSGWGMACYIDSVSAMVSNGERKRVWRSNAVVAFLLSLFENGVALRCLKDRPLNGKSPPSSYRRLPDI